MRVVVAIALSAMLVVGCKKPGADSSVKGADSQAAGADGAGAPAAIGDAKVPADLNQLIFMTTQPNGVADAAGRIQKMAADPVGKIYAAYAAPVPYLEGVLYRMRNILEGNDLAQLAVVTAARNFKKSRDVRAPHCDAFFEYLTAPNPGKDMLGQKGLFNNVSDLQNWVTGPLMKILIQSEGQLEDAAKANPSFVFDTALYFGDKKRDTIAKDNFKYKVVAPPHVWNMVADFQEAIGMAYYLASYDLDDLQQLSSYLTTQTLKASASDIFKFRAFEMHAVTVKEVTTALNRKEFVNSKLFTMRPQAEQGGYLKEAKSWIARSIDSRIQAHNGLIALADKPNPASYILNPKLYRDSQSLDALAELNQAKQALSSNDAVQFQDWLTNKPISVNLARFFDESNPGIKDLKKLFPRMDGFSASGEKLKDGKVENYIWNFTYGKPNLWPDPTFGGVLPGNDNERHLENLEMIARQPSLAALAGWLGAFSL